MLDRLRTAWTLWGLYDRLTEGTMDTNALINLFGSALLAGLAGAFGAFQGGAVGWKPILSAGTGAMLAGLVQHIRQSPVLPSRGPFPQ